MSKLGFTFYPKDWWTSDTFFELEPIERYIYLECIFLMYQNDGYIKTNKITIENRLRFKITDEVWKNVTENFKLDDNKFYLTSVEKRLRSQKNSIDNGNKGGRPLLEESLLSVFGDTIPRKPNPEDHYLYLFKRTSTDTYKVGETQDLFKRRLSIKVPTADLKIIHFVNIDPFKSLDIENAIKEKFKKNRLGGDWFDFDTKTLEELIKYFDNAKKLKNPPKNPSLEREREREREREVKYKVNTKNSVERFIKPNLEEVIEYFIEKNNVQGRAEAQIFYNYYESNGWKVGKNKMKKWKAAASGWLARKKVQVVGQKPLSAVDNLRNSLNIQ